VVEKLPEISKPSTIEKKTIEEMDIIDT